MMDIVIAKRIIDMVDGKNGCRRHTLAALSDAILGYEDQKTGEGLEVAARATLEGAGELDPVTVKTKSHRIHIFTEGRGSGELPPSYVLGNFWWPAVIKDDSGNVLMRIEKQE